nr:reverse transcriptase domain-containing protein [Tanacetum cinerariifolium]
MNDVSLKAMQNQIDIVKNELRIKMKTSIQTSLSNKTNEIKNMMASLLQINTASTSGSGTLPCNTIANPKGELKAITTRSGLVTEGPTVPNPPKSINPKEDECVEETYTDPDHAEYTIKVPPPPPVQKPKSPIQKILFCILGTLFHRISRLPDLIPTQMTLELANRAICTPDGITRDVFVPVGKFTFAADFVVVDYESNPRVPIILGRPFLRTTRSLIDVHGEEMILRDGDERLTLNMKHDTASYSNHPYRDSVNLINIFNLLSEDCLEDLDFSKNDVLFSHDNEDKVFNPGILSHEKSVTIITRVTQEKKLVVCFASLLFEDFDPPLYELFVFKEVPNSMRLLPFSSENEEKVFKPGIYTFKKLYCCFLSELSHPGFHVFKVNLIFLSPMKIFHVQNRKNTPPLDVLLSIFIPFDSLKYGGNLVQLI